MSQKRQKQPKQCKKCLRLYKIGGQAYNYWNCAICYDIQKSSSYPHAKVCNECAIENNCCYWCGVIHK